MADHCGSETKSLFFLEKGSLEKIGWLNVFGENGRETRLSFVGIVWIKSAVYKVML